MTNIKLASDIIKDGIHIAIEHDNKTREEYYKNKTIFINNFISMVKRNLEEIIHTNIMNKDNWYTEIMIDKDTLNNEINRIIDTNCRNEWYLIERYKNRLKYINNIEELETRLNEEGYTLVKVERTNKSFYGIYSKKSIFHRIYLKDANVNECIEKYNKIKDEKNDEIIKFITNKIEQSIIKYPVDKKMWYFILILDDKEVIKKKIASLVDYKDQEEISFYNNIITYLDIEYIKNKLDTFGYSVIKYIDISYYLCIFRTEVVTYHFRIKD